MSHILLSWVAYKWAAFACWYSEIFLSQFKIYFRDKLQELFVTKNNLDFVTHLKGLDYFLIRESVKAFGVFIGTLLLRESNIFCLTTNFWGIYASRGCQNCKCDSTKTRMALKTSLCTFVSFFYEYQYLHKKPWLEYLFKTTIT